MVNRGQIYYGSAVVIGKPYVAAFEFIKNDKRAIIGVLFVSVPEDVVYDPLKQEIKDTTNGQNGYFYVFDSRGTVISHPILDVGSSLADLPFIAQMIQKNANVTTTRRSMPYVYLGKYAVAYCTYFIPPIGWLIATCFNLTNEPDEFCWKKRICPLN